MLSLVFHFRVMPDPLAIFASFLLNKTIISPSFSVLVAWFRLKYPHVAIRGMASLSLSLSLYALVSSVPFPHFLKLFFGCDLFPLRKNFQWN